MLVMEKAAVTPDAAGLGKAKSVIKEKPLPASCVCAAMRCSTGTASSAVGAGPSHMMELQLPGATQGDDLDKK